MPYVSFDYITVQGLRTLLRVRGSVIGARVCCDTIGVLAVSKNVGLVILESDVTCTVDDFP